MKKYFLCDRKTALMCFTGAVIIFAFASTVPIMFWFWLESKGYSWFSNSFVQCIFFMLGNTYWFGLLVFLVLDIRKRNFGRSLSYFLGIGASFIALILVMVFGPTVADYSQRGHFDSEAWKKVATAQSGQRENPVCLRMVDDLLARYKLEGMSRAEVEKLLGKPPTTNYFKEYDFVYMLGPERSFISIDSEWLCIKFKNDVVSEVRICRD
ncbi:MAG: hypothetical protein KGS72_26730 [Cyanobacteria bacterium REEB67]|nr:hypothetical protein [Cyanobacteria bacterium REEB67]